MAILTGREIPAYCRQHMWETATKNNKNIKTAVITDLNPTVSTYFIVSILQSNQRK